MTCNDVIPHCEMTMMDYSVVIVHCEKPMMDYSNEIVNSRMPLMDCNDVLLYCHINLIVFHRTYAYICKRTLHIFKTNAHESPTLPLKQADTLGILSIHALCAVDYRQTGGRDAPKLHCEATRIAYSI